MSAPTGRIGEFQVNGTPCPVYMNMNTLSRFDELEEVSLLELATEVFGVVKKLQGESGDKESEEFKQQQAFAVIKAVKLKRIHTLAAAALHEYSRTLEPRWPYSPGQLGAILQFEQWAALTNLLLTGLMNFLPREGDVPKHVTEESQKPDPTKSSPEQNEKIDGGPPFTPSDAAPLDSLTMSSDEVPSEESA